MTGNFFDSKFKLVSAGVLLTALFYILFAAAFALAVYALDIDRKYIPFISTLCLAAASFLSSFIAAKKSGEKGYLIGAAVGGAGFLIVTLVALFVSKSGLSFNTLFHFLLVVLSSVIGGVLGVGNKKIL